MLWHLGFRVFGFRVWGFRVQGFRDLIFRAEAFLSSSGIAGAPRALRVFGFCGFGALVSQPKPQIL